MYGPTLLLRRAMLGPDGAAVTAALRARPEIAEAVRLRKQRAQKHLGMLDLVLAQLAGDAELEKTARTSFLSEMNGGELAIEALLLPGLAKEKAGLEVFREEAKGR